MEKTVGKRELTGWPVGADEDGNTDNSGSDVWSGT